VVSVLPKPARWYDQVIQLRDYQSRAFAATHEHWLDPSVRSVCVVMPTGSGKGTCAARFAEFELEQSQRAVFMVHRRQLVDDIADRFRSLIGPGHVGVCMAGASDGRKDAPLVVSIMQTLLARGERPPADLIIVDECHRVRSESYMDLLRAYPNARILGLTATPERQDRKPLGDVFQALVVGANYSELIAAGHLVDCRVCRYPAMAMKPGELANDPIKSWQRYAESSSTFAFWGNVAESREWCAKFNAAGIPSLAVDADSSDAERKEALARFESGEILVLHNVGLYTEGTDIPRARVCLLGAQIQGTGGYLQRVGRVLRPFPGKTDAILIDLVGASLLHYYPTTDREYSLEGIAITCKQLGPLRNCEKCGATIDAILRTCPMCGYERTLREHYGVTIHNLELSEVYAGASTPIDARTGEYRRLRELAKSRDYPLSWVDVNYRRLFKESPTFADVTTEEKKREFNRMLTKAKTSGSKPGMAAVLFKQMFGAYPPKNWSRGD
jgi:DNA repair protein RadD